MAAGTETIHATTISVGGRACLIRGPSGSGKSDLALRCLSLGPSPTFPILARLVADDQTILTRRDGSLIAAAPETIAGRLEIRGLGIMTIGYEPKAEVALIVDLGATEPQPRLPDPWPTARLLGLEVRLLRLSAHEASAAAKLLAALTFAEFATIVEDRR